MKKVRDEYKMTELGEIPEEWEIKKIKDIANICYGKSQKEVEVEEGKYKILGTGGVIGYTNDFLWNRPSVLIGRKGTIDKPQYIEEPFWTVDTLFYTKINENYIAKWFYYYLDNIDLKKYNEATGVPSLSVANLNTIRIATPTKKEQEKISFILSTVDEQIDNVDALIEKNKELKKGLMQTLLTKGIGHTKFKKTEIGEIPEEWEVINAGRVFNIITDYVANGSFASLAENVKYKESEDFAIVVRLTDYKNEYKGPFVYVDKNAYDFLSKTKLEDNDIIIANVGAYAGYVFRAPNINKPITLGPNAILVRSEQNREFIYYLLSSEFGQKAIKDIISTTAQPKFNKTDFKKILLPIPDLKEQYKIASILLEIDEKTEEYEKKKQKLEELKKGLMQQLLTGRIRV